MAIVFPQKIKIQKYLILVFFAILLITALVLWQGYLKKPRPALEPVPEIVTPPKKIEINFEILKNPILKELQPFEEILPFEISHPEEKIGRENPFIPYEIPAPPKR